MSDAHPDGDRRDPWGILFLVVGPSGVGKDTLIDAARVRLSGSAVVFARRVITRPADAGGEAHEEMAPDAFEAAARAGDFMAWWRAHGLGYGLRRELLDALRAGRDVVANTSRQALTAFAGVAPRIVVLSITAPPELVRARLEARGREDAAAVADRLARKVAIPPVAPVVEIANDTDVDTGVARFLAALRAAGDVSAVRISSGE
ncbi:phosphonate metabolism protein/1,5-bisphosphokinase (PRPP-forming) PhnN [Acuticoccus mangrovi]|uniref:Ribose 1,5-bisphosphate phosphokinase PhnN n=1 Tax=Acuticoccus mangrovi TaxID=2796142 RepID=A0A934IN05_9HYPH|nr:phosphonate metabolism protein/1,5-bisphosphokinase (PRPP-forming) PhnN [Acuticoccus mangrovi]MBJ3775373.1 phosphonate metabolism protein/1,5-bisphosphokinase (PRPP-forming) PhnN [Acuticoccus mangrovi]